MAINKTLIVSNTLWVLIYISSALGIKRDTSEWSRGTIREFHGKSSLACEQSCEFKLLFYHHQKTSSFCVCIMIRFTRCWIKRDESVSSWVGGYELHNNQCSYMFATCLVSFSHSWCKQSFVVGSLWLSVTTTWLLYMHVSWKQAVAWPIVGSQLASALS